MHAGNRCRFEHDESCPGIRKFLMKTFVAIVVACGVGLAVGYSVLSKKQAALQAQVDRLTKLQKDWDIEKASLEQKLKIAKSQPAGLSNPVVASSPPPEAAAAGQTPEQILDYLKSVRIGTGSKRVPAIRQVIHQLESLSDLREQAVPAIGQFLARFEDVDYGFESAPATAETTSTTAPVDNQADRGTASMNRNRARFDFVFPPSLRIGLVDVLKSIGGTAAESVLAEMLSTSGRAVEVAYVARALQEIAPDKYREAALAAVKDLLANPVSVSQPTRLDENAKSYLYSVMAMYNDPAFSTVAQALLITDDGRLDRNALNYLTGTMKEDAVPALYQAYKDPRMTNMWEKASIAGQVINYAGSNPQADQVFKEVVGNESIPPWMRAMTIQTLAGGTFFGGSSPSDATQIQARLNLLTSLPELRDQRMEEARKEAIQRLTDRLQGNGTAAAAQSAAPAATGTAPFPFAAGNQ